MRFVKPLFIMVLCVIVFPAFSAYGADVAKIGIIDIQKILKASSAGKQAQKEITAEGNRLKKDFEDKGKEIEELKKTLDKESLVISPAAREEKEREIRIKINDLKTLQKKYTEELKVFEARRVKRIQKDIIEVVEEIGKKDGYLLIMEKIGVLYYPNSVDITEKVIQFYNAKFAEKLD